MEAIAIDGRLGGGARSRMEAAGVTLDLEYTLYYQGVVSGTGSQTFEFANRLDGFVKLDTGALGEAFFPTDSGMEFPSDSPDTLVETSLRLSQRFGDRVSF